MSNLRALLAVPLILLHLFIQLILVMVEITAIFIGGDIILQSFVRSKNHGKNKKRGKE